MTKAEAIAEFNSEIKPHILAKYGSNDKPAMREAWNDWTDGLCKDQRIEQKQYDTWVHPF